MLHVTHVGERAGRHEYTALCPTVYSQGSRGVGVERCFIDTRKPGTEHLGITCREKIISLFSMLFKQICYIIG